MSVEANKENIRRHVDEIWHGGDLSVVDELFAPNYIIHAAGEEGSGPEYFKQFAARMRAAMSDLHFTIDFMIGEGDYVAVRYTTTGTFTGKLGDVPPTGNKMNRTEVVVYRFEDGRQAEAWTYADRLSTYLQLGIPLPTK